MKVLPLFSIAATWLSTTKAHMSMQYPYPRDTTTDGDSYATWQQNEPMWTVHPETCHGLAEDSTVRSGNAFAAGDFVEIDLYGTASHDGGHCAFWWTDDTSGDWYKIIDIVDCTIATDPFYVMMPYTMATACSTKCTFAFTWVPVSSGACEIYMNCAEVSVSGTTGLSATDTAITLNFDDLVSQDSPCVRVDDSTHYTTIFGTIKEDYTDDDANGGATTVTDTDATNVITVDDTEISESLENEDGALCSNDDAYNLDGKIANNGTCGTGTIWRCDDGQCCSAAGYCGPELGYYNSDGEAVYYHYLNGVRTEYNTSEEAFSDYCDNNQGDWRLVNCTENEDNNSGSGSGTSDMSTTPFVNPTGDSGVVGMNGNVGLGAVCAVIVAWFAAYFV